MDKIVTKFRILKASKRNSKYGDKKVIQDFDEKLLSSGSIQMITEWKNYAVTKLTIQDEVNLIMFQITNFLNYIPRVQACVNWSPLNHFLGTAVPLA